MAGSSPGHIPKPRRGSAVAALVYTVSGNPATAISHTVLTRSSSNSRHCTETGIPKMRNTAAVVRTSDPQLIPDTQQVPISWRQLLFLPFTLSLTCDGWIPASDPEATHQAATVWRRALGTDWNPSPLWRASVPHLVLIKHIHYQSSLSLPSFEATKASWNYSRITCTVSTDRNVELK